MRNKTGRGVRILVLAGIVALLGHGAWAAQGASSSTALPADVTKAALPNHAPAIESLHGETYQTFDADAATEAYLARIPAEKRAASNAYFEGGYWVILWDFLIGAAISI